MPARDRGSQIIGDAVNSVVVQSVAEFGERQDDHGQAGPLRLRGGRGWRREGRNRRGCVSDRPLIAAIRSAKQPHRPAIQAIFRRCGETVRRTPTRLWAVYQRPADSGFPSRTRSCIACRRVQVNGANSCATIRPLSASTTDGMNRNRAPAGSEYSFPNPDCRQRPMQVGQLNREIILFHHDIRPNSVHHLLAHDDAAATLNQQPEIRNARVPSCTLVI